jgi:tRNA pseudouridine55 synthase
MGMHGLLVVDKPIGWTSMDVIRKVRRSARDGRRQLPGGEHVKRIKCGHAGTLDPLATGVLVVGVGRATRDLARITGQTKRYVAEVSLAGFTPTDDAEGQPAMTPVPVDTPPTTQQIASALAGFRGEIAQIPPAYSAVHVGGRRAYAMARTGETVELEPRTVRIDALVLRDYAYPHLTLDITCGKGTYIRSLARDLGTALGTGGYLTGLRRTAVGDFTRQQATPMSRFETPLAPDDLIPIDR